MWLKVRESDPEEEVGAPEGRSREGVLKWPYTSVVPALQYDETGGTWGTPEGCWLAVMFEAQVMQPLRLFLCWSGRPA